MSPLPLLDAQDGRRLVTVDAALIRSWALAILEAIGE